jgi:hypothetical protein
MIRSGALLRTAFAVLVVLTGSVAPSNAQQFVRVTRDQTTIWKADFTSVAAVVPLGTTLMVVGQRREWYEVVVPGATPNQNERTGFVFAANIESTGTRASTAPPAVQRPARRAAEPRPFAPPTVSILVFGQLGYTRLAAHNSFAAVLGDPGGPVYGGGAEMRLAGGFFVNGAIEHFEKTGQRVLVADGRIFKLGIPNTVSMTPIAATAGWRFVNDRAVPYVGAGAGTLSYKENSSFADAGENVSSRFKSYHVLGGVEFRGDWVGTAFEVQYSRVPDALGRAGASAAFHESDLGGIAARVKVLVGR